MNVLHSEGIYRHIKFKQPGNSNLWFDLVTWPGCLTIQGDMGTWTFSRVEDMFTFFREDAGKPLSDRSINPSYWSEKLQHGTHGGSDGSKVWDEDTFRRELIGHLDGYDLNPDQRKEVEQALEDDVFSQDFKWTIILAAGDFSCDVEGYGKVRFDSCELPDGMVYAYHFLWCLYAIVWGIQQWDSLAAQPCSGPVAECVAK